MPKGCKHLTYEQRCQIDTLKERGDTISQIAKVVGVHRCTINRELSRNSGKRGYHYKQAQSKSASRRASAPNKKMTSATIFVIEEKLKKQWSPVQISGRMKKLGEGNISHETIYKHIWADKKKGGFLYKELRHCGKKYNKRSKGTIAGRGCIPGRIDITQRPSIVEEKIRLGDWELDTIVGAGQSGAIVSMVDRASKVSKLVKVSRKTLDNINIALIKKLKPLEQFVHTLTSDNGKEFAGHQVVAKELGAEFYFATPYHSWERGLNEHTNGLVRQYLPKEKLFTDISQEDVDRIEELINSRPRKILNFETPLETFARLSG